MAVQFSTNFTQRQYYYTDWLAAWEVRGGIPQSDASDGVYQKVWFYDGPEVHYCLMYLSGNPVTDPNYSQTQNDTDLAAFTSNVASSCNLTIEPKAENGRPQLVHTITKYTTNFQMRVFSFQTSNPSSLHNSSPTTAMSDVTYTCYDASGANVTSSPSTAVETVLDFMPSYAYEVIGGWMDVPDSSHADIVAAGPGFWYISALGVPDIPAAYGGSIPFVYEVDIALVPSGQQRIESEAGAVQYLKPSAYHTNKLRWIIKHPAGGTEWLQIFVRTYV
jgi:hypothetical protein